MGTNRSPNCLPILYTHLPPELIKDVSFLQVNLPLNFLSKKGEFCLLANACNKENIRTGGMLIRK